MSVPEAAVNKHDGPMLWQHKIRPTRQTRTTQAKAKSEVVQRTAKRQLWLCVS